MEESNRGIIYTITLVLPGMTKENHQRPQPGEFIFCPLTTGPPKYGAGMLTIQL
jgi:hypothetical protein